MICFKIGAIPRAIRTLKTSPIKKITRALARVISLLNIGAIPRVIRTLDEKANQKNLARLSARDFLLKIGAIRPATRGRYRDKHLARRGEAGWAESIL